MEKNIIVETFNLDTVAPLYCRFEGQYNPQNAYVEIDPRGDSIEISANYSGEIGNATIPERVYNKLVWQVACPYGLLGASLEKYLTGEDFKSQVLELCQGYEEIWDGSNQVGTWNEDAYGIAQGIETDLYALDYAEIYDGDEWIAESVYYYDADGELCGPPSATQAFWGDGPDRVEITAENLKKLVEDAESCIDSTTLVEGLECAFEEIIDNLKNN